MQLRVLKKMCELADLQFLLVCTDCAYVCVCLCVYTLVKFDILLASNKLRYCFCELVFCISVHKFTMHMSKDIYIHRYMY